MAVGLKNTQQVCTGGECYSDSILSVLTSRTIQQSDGCCLLLFKAHYHTGPGLETEVLQDYRSLPRTSVSGPEAAKVTGNMAAMTDNLSSAVHELLNLQS